MATTIGVRELRDHASQVLKRVSQGETIEVSNRGKVVARIVPAEKTDLREARLEWLRRTEALAQQISAHWQGPQDCVEAIREQRDTYVYRQETGGH